MKQATSPSPNPAANENSPKGSKVPPQPAQTTKRIEKADFPSPRSEQGKIPNPKTVALPGYPAPPLSTKKRPWWKFWGKKDVTLTVNDHKGREEGVKNEPSLKKPTPMKATAPNRTRAPQSLPPIDPAKVAAKSHTHEKSQAASKSTESPTKLPESKSAPPAKRTIPPIAKPKGPISYSASLDILPPIPLEAAVAKNQKEMLSAIENGQEGVVKAISSSQEKLGTTLSKVSSDITKISGEIEKSHAAAETKGNQIKDSLSQFSGSLGELRKGSEKSLSSMAQMNKLMTTVESGVKGMQGEVEKSSKAYDELVQKTEESARKQAEKVAAIQKNTMLVNILLGLGLIAVIIAYLLK